MIKHNSGYNEQRIITCSADLSEISFSINKANSPWSRKYHTCVKRVIQRAPVSVAEMVQPWGGACRTLPEILPTRHYILGMDVSKTVDTSSACGVTEHATVSPSHSSCAVGSAARSSSETNTAIAPERH